MLRRQSRFRNLLMALAVSQSMLMWATSIKALETDLENLDMDAWIASLEGAWVGGENVNRTPFGPIPFALLFERKNNGVLEALTSMSRSTWIKLRFHRGTNGAWLFTESAGLQGLGVQSHTMRAASAKGNTVEWATPNASFMTCSLTPDDEHMTLLVTIRGKEHIFFSLERVSDENVIAEIRQELLEARQRDGIEDQQRLAVTGQNISEGEPADIAYARAEVAADPKSAPAQMHLAKTLSQHLDTVPPMKMIAYASEMLAAMQTAVELDPQFAVAHYGLAQYYLNAPPIAGGSLEKAKDRSEVLRQLGSPLSEVVLALAAAKEGNAAAAEARLRKVLQEHPDLTEALDLLQRFTRHAAP